MAILPGPVIVIDLDHDRGRENVLQGCCPYMRRLVYNPAIYVHIYIYAYSSGGRQHSAALRPLQLQVRQGGLATHNKELNRYKYLTMYAHIYIYLSLSLSLSPSRLYCLFIVGGHQQSAVQRPPVQVHQGGILRRFHSIINRFIWPGLQLTMLLQVCPPLLFIRCVCMWAWL